MYCGPVLPKDNQYFSISAIAYDVGCSYSAVTQIASRLGYDLLIFRSGNKQAGYYTKEQKEKIAQAYYKFGTNYKKITLDELADNTTEDLHPLVQNKEFLKMNVWPDTVPVCFEE